ncbi:hypothetical protein Q1695_007149 [Nippostrongylus brasiliensis]|nr:hypothetical protein Q1695_007149 [Nippostrongylus brasiliensis]
MLQRTDGDLRLVLGFWTAGETYRTRVLFRNQTDDFTISMLKNNIMNQLTNDGVKEMYELGLWLRERYITNSPFVSASIQRDETVIESSARRAALESAEAVVEGLFCSKYCNTSSNDIARSWLPFAIQPARMSSIDWLLDPVPMCCKDYNDAIFVERKELYNRLEKQEEYRKIVRYLGRFGDKRNKFGLPYITKAFRILELVRLTPRAILESDIVNGTTVLQWILQNYRQYMLSLVNSKTKARLTVGTLLNDLISTIDDVASSTERVLKARFLSTADARVLTALKYALGVEVSDIAPPGSALILELHDSDDGQAVEVYTRTSEGWITQRKMMHCGHRCPLRRFFYNVQPMALTQEDLNRACSSAHTAPSIVLIIGFLLYNFR